MVAGSARQVASTPTPQKKKLASTPMRCVDFAISCARSPVAISLRLVHHLNKLTRQSLFISTKASHQTRPAREVGSSGADVVDHVRTVAKSLSRTVDKMGLERTEPRNSDPGTQALVQTHRASSVCVYLGNGIHHIAPPWWPQNLRLLLGKPAASTSNLTAHDGLSEPNCEQRDRVLSFADDDGFFPISIHVQQDI